MEYIQDFNFHTHTERCGHAEKDYDDEGYVKEATGVGIKFLAFTDHIPLKETKDEKNNVRMGYEEIVLIGDSENDKMVCYNSNMIFYGVNTGKEKWNDKKVNYFESVNDIVNEG